MESARFHSAEHMAINFYNSSYKVPTLDEIKKASKYSRFCSSYPIIKNFLFGSCFAILYFFILEKSGSILMCLGLLVLATLLLTAIIFILEKLDLIKYLEALFLLKPTDKELEVAIEELKAWIEMENNSQEFPVFMGIVINFENVES